MATNLPETVFRNATSRLEKTHRRMNRAKIPLPTPIMIDISSQARYEETTLQTCDTDVNLRVTLQAGKWKASFEQVLIYPPNTSTYFT